MNLILPPKLFRGDDDHENKRSLRATSHFSQFQTNLINGGIGKKIFTEPLMELTNEHILSRFPGSHFLSFTDSKLAAFRYGLNLQEADQNVVDLCCTQYLEDDKQWDFALLTIETSLLDIKSNPFPGVYECWYHPTLLEFVPFGFYRIFLIDTVTALKHANPVAFKTALEYSQYDHEWLVLPATPKNFHGRIEYSAVLDGGCFSRNYYYEIDREQRELHNIISYS
ncbi:MAG: hypothetical protein ACXVJD_03125 [Mucilaginibacter sp.]